MVAVTVQWDILLIAGRMNVNYIHPEINSICYRLPFVSVDVII